MSVREHPVPEAQELHGPRSTYKSMTQIFLWQENVTFTRCQIDGPLNIPSRGQSVLKFPEEKKNTHNSFALPTITSIQVNW